MVIRVVIRVVIDVVIDVRIDVRIGVVSDLSGCCVETKGVFRISWKEAQAELVEAGLTRLPECSTRFVCEAGAMRQHTRPKPWQVCHLPEFLVEM